MKKTHLVDNINVSMELFPKEALKKAPCAKGKNKDLEKEYYSIDDIEKLTQE